MVPAADRPLLLRPGRFQENSESKEEFDHETKPAVCFVQREPGTLASEDAVFSLYVEARRAKQSASTTRGSKYGVVTRLDRLLA